MTKKDLAIAAAIKLREKDIRKPVHICKQKFIISDSSGNNAELNIKPLDKNVIYTIEDANNMIDAIIECVEDALRNGDEISIKGFGNLHLHKRAARRTKQPGTDKWFDVEERLVPKFDYGTSLKMAARSYELLMKERMDAKYIENLYIEQCFDESDLDDSMSDIMSVGEIE